MLAWLLLGDGDIEEVDVDVYGALLLPDDKLLRIIKMISVLSGLVDDDQSLHLSESK